MKVFIMLVSKSHKGTVIERQAPRPFSTLQKAISVAMEEYPNLLCVREVNTQRRLFNAEAVLDDLGYSVTVHVYATELVE